MLQERRIFRRILKTVPGCYTSLIARMIWLWACARSWPHYVTLVSAPFFFTQKSISAGKSGRPKLFYPYNAIRDGRLATTLTLRNLRMTTRYVKCLLNFSHEVASGFVGLRVREEAARQPRQAKAQIDLRNSVSKEFEG